MPPENPALSRLDINPILGLHAPYPVPSNEGRLISVVRCWGGERWLVGVSEIRRNKPISGPSRLVPTARAGSHWGGRVVAIGAETLAFNGLDTRA